MRLFNLSLRHAAVAAAAFTLSLSASAVFGQQVERKETKEEVLKIKDEVKIKMKEERGFCSNNNWSGNDKVSFNELREMTVSAGGTIAVDAGQNGGIGVKGEDRNDVLVRACIQAWGRDDAEARGTAANVRIGTGPIKADGADDRNFSVSYQILVPRSSNLNLTAHNGGISIANVDGNSEFQTMNGGVSLSAVSGNVKGRTTNGGVNVNLAGTSWKGGGLDVTTSNGGVHISMPDNYAAHVETGTVNGGFVSDIPSLNVANRDENGKRRPGAKISQDLNGGGAPIRVITTNGGVKISSSNDKD
jgi:hypothetical protein